MHRFSENHNLEELRNKQPSDDECSLHYERSGMEEPEDAGQDDNDVYDDTNEDLYEDIGSVQPAAPSQQSSPPIQYEIGAVASPPKPGLYTEKCHCFIDFYFILI